MFFNKYYFCNFNFLMIVEMNEMICWIMLKNNNFKNIIIIIDIIVVRNVISVFNRLYWWIFKIFINNI